MSLGPRRGVVGATSFSEETEFAFPEPPYDTWGVRLWTMFDMAGDSDLFATAPALEARGCRLQGGRYLCPTDPGELYVARPDVGWQPLADVLSVRGLVSLLLLADGVEALDAMGRPVNERTGRQINAKLAELIRRDKTARLAAVREQGAAPPESSAQLSLFGADEARS